MKVLAFAICCLGVVHGFDDAPKPICVADNVDAGSVLMPHERYCQLFYSCNEEYVDFPAACHPGFLFSYTVGLANCLPAGDPRIFCPNWPCDGTVNTLGDRFPDVCCSQYWECTATGLVQLPCGNDLVFDQQAEICVGSTGATCVNSQFCPEIADTDQTCIHFPSSDGDPCKFQTLNGGVFTQNRRCPDGVAFDAFTCSCSNYDDACNNQHITYEQALENKAVDELCRASRVVDFSEMPPRTTSDKINQELRHWFLYNGVVAGPNNEAVFFTAGPDNFLYDFFFNDNELFAPLGMRMTFRLNNLFQPNQVATLLSNQFSQDPNNFLCTPATFQISIRFNGISGGLQSYTIVISVQGANGNFAIATGTVSGNPDDYFTMTLIFAGTITVNVYNRGTSPTSGFSSPVTITSAEELGGKLRPNKCGFVIGRNFAGVIREFNTYEGCGNFQNLLN